jgi:hypothetical protein
VRARLAGWLDGAGALVVTMIAWPFPLARAMMPWPVHVVSILAAILVVDALLRATSVLAWGRTPFMYLLDLGLERSVALATPGAPSRASAGVSDHAEGRPEPPATMEAVKWSVGWTIGLVPSLLGARSLVDPERGLPARWSGLLTRSAH